MKAAIYARMSTDRQNADSPADQVARCREFAAGARGWHVVEELVVVEAGVSGASRHNRPGLLGLLERIAEWDVLLCWDSTRLARDSEDLGWVRNRLRANRRTGYEVSSGLDLFNVGAKVLGIIGEEYLVKLRADTQRGLLGRAERGLSTGGLPYGYRSEAVAVDGEGRALESAGRRVVIHEAEAAVVRRLFECFLAGAGLKALAHRLNGEAVAPPRPRALSGRPASWAPTAIREMLRNRLYVGERIFNRSEWVKDHETGRRRRFERPESEWVREDRPDLAILPRELFDAVETELRRRTIPTRSGGRKGRAPGRHVLSGFLECGVCGGSFHALDGSGRYGCSWRRSRGPTVCAERLLVPRLELEGRIFEAVRERVLTPEGVAFAVERALGLVEAELRAPAPTLVREARARLVEVEADLAALRRVGDRTGRSVAALVAELETERTTILAAAARPPAAVALEALRPVIEARVGEYRSLLTAAPESGKRALRALLGDRRMHVYRDDERGFRVEGLFELTLEARGARDRLQSPGSSSTGSGGRI